MAGFLAGLGSSIARSAAGGLVGSLFGNKGQSRNEDYIEDRKHAKAMGTMQGNLDAKFRHAALRDDPQQLVTGALKAGFNPLTVLGATGGQTGVTGSNPFTPLGRREAPISPAQSAAQAAGQAIINYDPIEEERRRLENELLETQIKTHQNKNQRLGLQGVSTTTSPVETDVQKHLRPGTQYPNKDNPLTDDPSKVIFPVVDPSSVRPEDARITHGPYRGRYVIRNTEGIPFISPKNFTPSAFREEIQGSITGETMSTAENLMRRGWTRAYVNDGGQIIGKRPKTYGQSRRETEMGDKPNFGNNNRFKLELD